MKTFLDRLIAFQTKNRFLFLSLLIGFIVYGVYVAIHSEIEAFPELTNTQVQVITQVSGKAAEEMERQVTVPLEVATNGLSGLINQRSISIFGLSVITLTFDDDVKLKTARLDVAQRLGDATLPDGVKPSLSPDSTPVGEVFRYTLAGSLPTDELRLIEDWTLEKEFKGIPGVADVVSFGGPSRTIEVKVDLPKIKSMGLSIANIAQALGQNHANAGGRLITRGEETVIVRSLGLYEKPENLEDAVVATQNRVPIRVRDIGRVEIGHKQRLGQVGKDADDDVVEGVILLRQGANTLETCARIQEKIKLLNGGILPKGAVIEPYYDRTELIGRSSHTVLHNILFGVFLVCALLLIGLGTQYWQVTIAVALIIPFALLISMVGLKVFGYVPNLISLGAVDFGIIVETAIFAGEALIFKWAHNKTKEDGSLSEILTEVLAPSLLCAALLIIAFVPILSLQRVEGRIFRPLGITLVCAVIGGQIGALIFIPAVSQLIQSSPPKYGRVEAWVKRISDWFESLGKRLAEVAQLELKTGIVLATALAALLAVTGREFLPTLNEGSLFIRATAPSTISREASVKLSHEIRELLKTIPEVVNVIAQIGRPDDGTDVNGFDNDEFTVVLVPPEMWKSASSLDGLVEIVQRKLSSIRGVEFNYSQPIKDNVDEAISGVKGELVLKVFGNKLDELQVAATRIEEVLKTVPGAEDVGAEKLLGQPELRFVMNREILARYGLRVTDAEDVLESSTLGKSAATLIDEQGRAIDIVVKADLSDNPSIDQLRSLPVITPDGAKIPLGDVASASLHEGVARIYREEGKRRIAVKCSVRNRSVVEFVKDADEKIRAEIKLPEKFSLRWYGSFENAQRASSQLLLIIPLCVAVMLVLLFTWFRSWRVVGLLLWELPFSVLGGLALLKLFGLNLSISAAAGAVVLIGVCLLTGMMLISGWLTSGSAWTALQKEARAILLSSGVAIIGLVPAAFSHGIGSETAKPFAVMILGGLTSSLLLSLAVLPALIESSERRNRD